MDNIFNIWEAVNFIADKSRRGFLSPEQVSIALDFGQNQIWATFLEQSQQGDELARVALNPFKKTLNSVTNASGVLSYPADHGKTDSIFTTVNAKKRSIRQTLFDEVDAVVNSSIYPIGSNPAFTLQDGNIQVYPQALTAVEWHYISSPVTPVIGYTVPVKVPVYNPATSVQLQFNREYWFSILLKGLPAIGVNLSDQEVGSLTTLFANTPSAAE